MQLMFKHLCEAFTQLTDHSLCAHLQLSPGSFHTHTLQFLHTAHEIIEWEGSWEGCYRSPCCNPPAIDRDVTSSSGYLNHPNSLLYKVQQVVSHNSEYMQPRHAYSHLYFYSFIPELAIKRCNKLQAFLIEYTFSDSLGSLENSSSLLSAILPLNLLTRDQPTNLT